MSDPYNGKYCKDCKHSVGNGNESDTCSLAVRYFHPVKGPVYVMAFEIRTSKDRDLPPIIDCAEEGKLWEPKDETDS